jgi:hypothetical protein
VSAGPSKDALAGQYSGTPDLRLEVDEKGNAKGSFEIPATMSAFSNAAPATLKGKLRGRALLFTWKLIEKESSWFSPKPSRGHGVLTWSETGLSGFRMGGDWELDLTDAEGFTEWNLTKQVSG